MDFEEHLLKENLRKILSKKEEILVISKIFYKYSDSEIAKQLGVSK